MCVTAAVTILIDRKSYPYYEVFLLLPLVTCSIIQPQQKCSPDLLPCISIYTYVCVTALVVF